MKKLDRLWAPPLSKWFRHRWVQPRSYDQGSLKNDAFNLSASLPSSMLQVGAFSWLVSKTHSQRCFIPLFKPYSCILCPLIAEWRKCQTTIEPCTLRIDMLTKRSFLTYVILKLFDSFSSFEIWSFLALRSNKQLWNQNRNCIEESTSGPQ